MYADWKLFHSQLCHNLFCNVCNKLSVSSVIFLVAAVLANEIILISRELLIVFASACAAVMAVQCVFVQADICRMFAGHTEFTADSVQFLNILLVEFLRAAQKLALIQELSVELNRFPLPVSGAEVCGPGDRSVVLQKHCVVLRKVFLKVVRARHCARCAVLSDGYASQSDNCLGHGRLCQRNACDSEGCCIDGLSMYDRSD